MVINKLDIDLVPIPIKENRSLTELEKTKITLFTLFVLLLVSRPGRTEKGIDQFLPFNYNDVI